MGGEKDSRHLDWGGGVDRAASGTVFLLGGGQ